MTVASDKTRHGPRGPGGGHTVDSASLAAGIMLMLSGPLSILMGAAGIANDGLFVTSTGYAYNFGLTSWGIIHLAIGIVLVVAGFGLLAGMSWGRGLGVVAAGISLITQFMFVPYYPAWAIPVMALDLLILFALTRSHIERAR
ncbi:hypothetical protein ACFY5K_16150 [Streptomyces griseofuscus]|uniref:DUF7144 family membrane protein n=1 Tax=Streptomyces TaxID=1883 RepID=UPI00081F2360|nr:MULTISPECIES: hypothetical protein [unclassified Streptomyces]MBJ7002240.1 hypothetical protein [Streptomyces sp. CRPSP2-6A1]MYQ90558.1 hypothetical protein [Streptomyces sp. SID4946]SCF61149.1 hypothetical protein GA0115256_105611 [Streptomyces sp. DconLS]SCF72391.1 hypothetical protein GA0115258_110311 [Streptomyces sp. LamerLS-31b]